MVTRLIFTLLLLPFCLFSGEFIASVNRNQMNLGEGFSLNLTLKDASARGIPSLSSLQKTFLINSEQQSSNTVIINGKVTTSTTWNFILIPQGEGEWVIPSVSIETSEGTLSSEPITISVVKGGAPRGSESSDIDGVTLTAEVSNAEPYKNEPIVYTVKLASKRNLANIQMQKINVEDAIVEVNGEPKVYAKNVGGVHVDIAEFSYLITPLKAGVLKIPSAVVQGGVPIKRRAHVGSLFDNNFDPFSVMQGFDQLKPFALTTEEIILEVEPAVAGMDFWLPAQSLKIEEVLDESSRSLQEGDPFTRSFKIIAEGVKSNQLPSLNDLQVDSRLFKIYADKPEFGDEIKNGNITSYRKENYTLIPEKSGTLTLPEISVVWWDVVHKEKKIARVPAKTLYVLPSLAKVDEPKQEESPQKSEFQTTVIVQRDPVLYIVIAGLLGLLIIAAFFGIMLQKKITRLTERPKDLKDLKEVKKEAKTQKKRFFVKKTSKSKSDKKEKLPDLNPT